MELKVLTIDWDDWRNTWLIRHHKCIIKSKKKNVVEIKINGIQRSMYISNDAFKEGGLLFKASDDVYTSEIWAAADHTHVMFILQEDDKFSYNSGMIKFYRVISTEHERISLLGRKIEQAIKNSIYAHGFYSLN